ncbi:MAG: YihY/virulence factor BrkB family protein [Lachnospiraceae bacterium]|nr:YihY/virulence factor BrkB family protein [Lachnospiraceae bacterium]
MGKAGYALLKVFLTKLRKDNVSAFAAQTAFFVILSFLPFLIFLISLVKFFPIGEERLLSMVQSAFPTAVHDFIGGLLLEARQKALGTVLSVSAVAALWSASKGALAVIRGLNGVYGNEETRNYITLRLLAFGYTLVFALVLILVLVALVFGNRISAYIQSNFPVTSQGIFFAIGLRVVVSFFVLTEVFFLTYVYVPGRKPKRMREELPGAALSATGWLVFSFLFSVYIDHLGRFSAMYGSLTAVVLCMMWLYVCMYIMFVGAEVNVMLSEDILQKEWFRFLESFRRKRE